MHFLETHENLNETIENRIKISLKLRSNEDTDNKDNPLEFEVHTCRIYGRCMRRYCVHTV